MTKIMLHAGTGKGYEFSIEAGISDGRNHFDHHRMHSDNPCPANDDRIPVVPNGSTIMITHIDADCFIGILRMLGKSLPDVDLELLEKIDLNGSSGIDKWDKTLLYMLGIGAICRRNDFPRCSENPQDVTEKVLEIAEFSTDQIEDVGRQSQSQSEKAYQKCLVQKAEIAGFWAIGSHDQFDPSRPYEDGINIVVVFRSHYKSISIYCSPTSTHEFADKEVAGIKFAGHPKACGSPRGEEFNVEDAMRVYEEIA